MRQMISPVISKETAYIMRNVSNLFLYFFWLLELFVYCFLYSSTICVLEKEGVLRRRLSLLF